MTIRDLPPLQRGATFQPSTLNENKRTIELVWSTGEKVLRTLFDRFWEQLSLDPRHVHLDRLNGGAPLLDAHNAFTLGGVIGAVVPGTARVDGNTGTATVRFPAAADDPNADTIWKKLKAGIIRAVSIGYRVHTFEKIENADEKIPTYRAIDWTPYEISLVPIGADAGAQVRGAALILEPCRFRDLRMDHKYRHLTVEDADRLRWSQLAQAQLDSSSRARCGREDDDDRDTSTHNSRRGRQW